MRLYRFILIITPLLIALSISFVVTQFGLAAEPDDLSNPLLTHIVFFIIFVFLFFPILGLVIIPNRYKNILNILHWLSILELAIFIYILIPLKIKPYGQILLLLSIFSFFIIIFNLYKNKGKL